MVRTTLEPYVHKGAKRQGEYIIRVFTPTGEHAGFVGFRKRIMPRSPLHPRSRGYLLILFIEVDEQYQHLGYGSEMIERLLDKAEEENLVLLTGQLSGPGSRLFLSMERRGKIRFIENTDSLYQRISIWRVERRRPRIKDLLPPPPWEGPPVPRFFLGNE